LPVTDRTVDATIKRLEKSLKTEEEHTLMKNLLNSGLELSKKLASLSEGLKDENAFLQRLLEDTASRPSLPPRSAP
jgi:hypothetical protein